MGLRIAWAGPWNERSAIAAFGVDIVSALAAGGHHVEVFRTEAATGAMLEPLPAPYPVQAPGHLTSELLSGGFDQVFVNVGNYFAFHGAAIDILNAVPSVLIAHDSIMSGFQHGWFVAGSTPGGLVPASIGADWHNSNALLGKLAELAVGGVVHAAHYVAEIEAACPGPVAILPLGMLFHDLCDGLTPPFQNDDFVVATIGHLNSNKCVDQVVRAIGASPLLRQRVRYLLMGPVEEHYRKTIVALSERYDARVPEFTGQISDTALRERLHEVDVVCCLRNPISEGGSASLILAMRAGRPTLVSDHASYSDLPENVVLKCPPGREAAHVVHFLELLMENPAFGRQIGDRARAYAAQRFAPEVYAAGIVQLAERAAHASPFVLARRRIRQSLRSLNLPSDRVAVQNATRGLTSLIGEQMERH